jgi:hypothetical protein
MLLAAVVLPAILPNGDLKPVTMLRGDGKFTATTGALQHQGATLFESVFRDGDEYWCHGSPKKKPHW